MICAAIEDSITRLRCQHRLPAALQSRALQLQLNEAIRITLTSSVASANAVAPTRDVANFEFKLLNFKNYNPPLPSYKASQKYYKEMCGHNILLESNTNR